MTSASEKCRLIASDIENLRLHYALTLRHWLDRAIGAARAIVKPCTTSASSACGNIYLAGGIVMFESGAACNYQVQYIRDRRALPITRDYMAEAEARYRKIGAEQAPAKIAPARRRTTASPEFAK